MAGNIVVYALIIVPVESIELAEAALSKTKEKFGASSTARIHCKELLHKDTRKNTEWSHLNHTEAWDLLLGIKDNLANLRIGTRVGYVIQNEWTSHFPGVGSIGGIARTNIKQLIPFSFLAATGQLAMDPEYAGVCKLWIDPNKDLINWFGSNAKIGRLLKTNLIDPNNRSIDTVMTPENLVSKDKPALLDLADLLAYCSSRVLSSSSRTTKYESDRSVELIYKTMNPQIAKMSQANQQEATEGVLKNFSVNIK